MTLCCFSALRLFVRRAQLRWVRSHSGTPKNVVSKILTLSFTITLCWFCKEYMRISSCKINCLMNHCSTRCKLLVNWKAAKEQKCKYVIECRKRGKGHRCSKKCWSNSTASELMSQVHSVDTNKLWNMAPVTFRYRETQNITPRSIKLIFFKLSRHRIMEAIMALFQEFRVPYNGRKHATHECPYRLFELNRPVLSSWFLVATFSEGARHHHHRAPLMRSLSFVAVRGSNNKLFSADKNKWFVHVELQL